MTQPDTAGGRPVVTVSYEGGRLVVAWTGVTGAFQYRVVVRDADGRFVDQSDMDASPRVCDFAPVHGAVYTATVTPVGLPSDPVRFTVPYDAAEILAALRVRLEAARTADDKGGYVYVFGPDVVGRDTSISAYTMTARDESVLTATTLTLGGTSAAVTAVDGTAATVVFSVADGMVQALWTATPPDGYLLGDTYPDLQEVFDYYGLRDQVFTVDATTGLAFQTVLPVPLDLWPDPDDAPGVALGGPIAADGTFAWTAGTTLGPITVNRIGAPYLTLVDGVAAMTERGATITGRVRLNPEAAADETPIWVTGTADLPTIVTAGAALRITGVPAGDASGVLGLCGLDAVAARLPGVVLDLLGVRVRDLSIGLSPGDVSSVTTATVDFGDGSVSLAEGITLSDFHVTAELHNTAGYEPSGSVVVSGTLAFGDTVCTVSAGAYSDQPWMISIASAVTPDAMAAVGNTTMTGIAGLLPMSLNPGIAVLDATVTIDPVELDLVMVEFTIGQTRDWAAGPFTLSGWTVRVELAADADWEPLAEINGTVTVADVDMNVYMIAPLTEGDQWSVSLDPESTIHLPSLGDLLAELGTPPPLPSSLATLGDLDITTLELSFDPGALTLTRFVVGIDQAGTWVVVEDGLTIEDVNAYLSFDRADGVAGRVSGTVVVCGERVDAALTKSVDDGWLVRAAYSEVVHVPGLTDLDDWLDEEHVSGGLPANLPLAHGFDLADVWAEFDGDGVYRGFGFSFYAEDLWTFANGFVSLTEVGADLALGAPVSADTVIADVNAVLTIGGARIGLTASTPGTGTWTFTGTLLESLTIDVIGALTDLAAETGFALPADSRRFGLPERITIAAASVTAVPDDDEFHFAGLATFQKWEFDFGGAKLAILAFGARIDVDGVDEPLTAALTGVFTFAGITSDVTVALGQAATPTIISGHATNAAAVDLAAITGIGVPAGGAAGGWAAVAPSDLELGAFVEVAYWLDLTGERFLVTGGIEYGKPDPEQPLVPLTRAQALVYCAKVSGTWSYTVALGLGDGFRFADLFPALDVVDAVVRVRAARVVVCDLPVGTTLGATTAVIGTALDALGIPLGDSPLNGLSTTDAAKLETGVYAVAELDFSFGLVAHIAQIGSLPDDAPLKVIVYALVQPERSTFGAIIPDITVIEDKIVFTGIELTYTVMADDTLTLSATAAITDVFPADYSFDIDLKITDSGLTSSVTPTGDTYDNPFSLPGITLSALELAVAYTWAPDTTSSYALQGDVTIGGVTSTAAIAVVNGEAALFSLKLADNLAIGAFFSQIIGVRWPGDFIEIMFLKDSRITYAATATTYDGADVPAGFALTAKVRLTLITSLDLDTVVTVVYVNGRYVGVEARISLTAPLDLYVIQLTGPPSLTIDTARDTLKLTTGVSFLGAPFANLGVAVHGETGGPTTYTAEITAGVDVDPFGTPHFTFSYVDHGPDRQGEFRIDDWPLFEWPRELIDFMAVIRSLSDLSKGCGELADLVTRVLYSTKWRLKPGVRLDGTDIVFDLTGSYELYVLHADDPFLTVTLKPFSVPIPVSVTWSELPEALAAGIGRAAVNIVRDLLADPESISILVGVVAGQEALAAGMQLACQGLVDALVGTAAQAARNAVLAAESAVEVTAAALTTAVTAVLSGHDSGGSSGSGSSGGGSSGGSSGGGSSGGSGSGSSDGGTTTTPAPEAPAITGFTFDGTTFAATWDPSRYAAGYTFEVVAPDGRVLGSAYAGFALDASVTAVPDAPGTYVGRVRGVRGGELSAWVQRTLTKTAPPHPLVVFAPPELIITWENPAGATVPDSYQLTVGQVGDPFPVSMTLAADATEARFPVQPMLTATYEVRLRAPRSAELPGDWGGPITIEVTPPVASNVPQNLAVADDGTTVTFTWDPVEGFGQYLLRFLDASGEQVMVMETNRTRAEYDSGDWNPAGGVVAQVSISHEELAPTWSGSVELPIYLAVRLADAKISTVTRVTMARYPAAEGWCVVPRGAAGTLAALAHFAGLLRVHGVLHDPYQTMADGVALISWDDTSDGRPVVVWQALRKLISVMIAYGTLPSTAFTDVAGDLLSARAVQEWGGWQLLLALGNPVGGPCTTESGQCGDIILGVTDDRIAGVFGASQDSGWLPVTSTALAARTLLQHLVDVIRSLNLIAADEAASIFEAG